MARRPKYFTVMQNQNDQKVPIFMTCSDSSKCVTLYITIKSYTYNSDPYLLLKSSVSEHIARQNKTNNQNNNYKLY